MNYCDYLRNIQKNIGIIPFDNERIDKSLLDTRNLIDYEIPSYEQIVKDLVCDLKKISKSTLTTKIY